jgi:excisionase family DNA binding protein
MGALPVIRKEYNYNNEEKLTLCKSTVKKPEVPIWKKTTLTIEEAAEYSNIGQNKLTELLKRPRCSFVLYVGKKKLVKRKAFEEFLADNVEL